MQYYWFRLPEGDRARLLSAIEEEDLRLVVHIVNQYRIAPDIVTMCCGSVEAWNEAVKKSEEWK